MPNHITNNLTIEGEGAHEFLWRLINRAGQLDFNKLIKLPKSLHFNPSFEAERLAELLIGELPPFKGKDPDAQDKLVSDEIERLKTELGSKFSSVVKEAMVCVENIKATGYPSWYEACVNLWGTKWSAYSQDFNLESSVPALKTRHIKTRRGTTAYRILNQSYVNRILRKRIKAEKITSVTFQTAWNTPTGFWEAMVKALPDGLLVRVDYADEDLGSNAGHFSFNSKGIISSDVAPYWGDMTADERLKWTKFAFHTIYGEDADPKDHDMNENYEYEEE